MTNSGKNSATHSSGPACPVGELSSEELVTLAHGEGGRLTRQFIARHILPTFSNAYLQPLHDAAQLPEIGGPCAMACDAFVISPLFFPGGDIGRLAVTGTLNDLVVGGAEPLWLSLALVIEEGLPLETLDRVLVSAAAAARDAGVCIVCGDTKVVPRGAADKLFLTTTGIGKMPGHLRIDPGSLRPGDTLIVSGPIGQHGIAVLAAREGLDVAPVITSDCGYLGPAVAALIAAGVEVRAMRDATRGGVAAVLHEWSAACGHTLSVDEQRLPLTSQVRALCELLGLDPLMVACEGSMLLAVPEGQAAAALKALHQVSISRSACVIGRVQPRRVSPVTVVRSLGREVALDEPSGALLPRIC